MKYIRTTTETHRNKHLQMNIFPLPQVKTLPERRIQNLFGVETPQDVFP